MGDGRPATCSAAMLKAAMPLESCGRNGRRARSARRIAAPARVAEDLARSARAARRVVPPCGRCRPRPGRARPSRRADRRFHDRRRARRRGSGRAYPASGARAAARRHHPRARPLRHRRAARISRRIAACRARRAARPRRQGRGAGAADASSAPHAIRVYTPHGGSLVYRPGTLSRRLLPLAGMGAEMAHRSCSCSRAAMSPACSAPRSAARRRMVRVVHNGVGDAEFAPIVPRRRRHRYRLPRRIAAGQSLRRADRGAGGPQSNPAGR